MSQDQIQVHHVGRAGWFAVGALAASIGFVLLFIVGDYFNAVSNSDFDAQMPVLAIEGQ